MAKHNSAEMASLHEAVLNGDKEAPSRWSVQGWRYNRWRKESDKHAKVLEARQRRAGGVPPVRAEKPFGFTKPRGMTGRNSGYAAVQSGPQEWQTTTNLGCGFNPNVVGAPAPVIGTPLGRHVTTQAEVACDPMAWFREGIIANPSAFVLSLPGLGKSTLIRKMLMGAVAAGHTVIAAGDIKGEYVGFTQQVGGQVITLGHGVGRLNPLDVGALGRVIPRIERERDEATDPQAREHLDDVLRRAKEQIHGRQVSMVDMLVGLSRGEKIKDYESMLVSAGLREMYEGSEVDWANPPILRDLIDYLEQGSPNLRHSARARSDEQWSARVDALILSLNSLLDGATGQIFSGQTTTPIDVDATAVCIDVSAIGRSDKEMKAAVMMSCWQAAFGAIEAAHMLSDAGLAPQRYFAVTLDELWQVLSSAPGMVGQIDSLTRLNRSEAVQLYMITHTFHDLEALPTEEDLSLIHI